MKFRTFLFERLDDHAQRRGCLDLGYRYRLEFTLTMLTTQKSHRLPLRRALQRTSYRNQTVVEHFHTDWHRRF